MPSIWPGLVVFDLDHTLWHRPRFRVGPPWRLVEDGLGGVRSSSGEHLYLFPGARRALLALSDANVPVALASRTHRVDWALQWLALLRLEPDGRTVADVVGSWPVIIRDGPKTHHLHEITQRTGVPLSRTLFFDDDATDVCGAKALGCVAVHCASVGRHRRGRLGGLTDELFFDGIRKFANRATPGTEESLLVGGSG